MADNPKKKTKLITFTDFISGGIAGIVDVLISQPLEIIKVRQQTSNKQISAFNVARDIMVKEGPLAFYKGTLSPLLGISFAIAMDFTGFEFGKRLICSYKQIEETQMTKLNVMFSGAFAGLFYSVIISPTELFRIKMQVLSETSNEKYKSSIDAAVKIIKTYGITGIFKGYLSTFVREVFGGVIYFGVYEILMQGEQRKFGGDRNQIPTVKILCFGACSGTLYSFITYPFDVIKTIMQGNEYNSKKYSSISKTAIVVYNEQGLNGFYKGLGICLLRAVIGNAVTFVTYEKVKSYLS